MIRSYKHKTTSMLVTLFTETGPAPWVTGQEIACRRGPFQEARIHLESDGRRDIPEGRRQLRLERHVMFRAIRCRLEHEGVIPPRRRRVGRRGPVPQCSDSCV